MNRTLALFLALFLCFSFTAVSFPTEAVGGYVGKKVAKQVGKKLIKKNFKKANKTKPKGKSKGKPKDSKKNTKKEQRFKDRTAPDNPQKSAQAALNSKPRSTPKKLENPIKQADAKFLANAKPGKSNQIKNLARKIRRDKCKILSASGCDAKINQTLQQKGLLKNSQATPFPQSSPKVNAYASTSLTPAKNLTFPSKRALNISPQTTKTSATKSKDIQLKYNKNWTAEQRKAADRKCKALCEANTVVTKTKRSGTAASTRYKQAGKSVAKGQDVDHVHELQLGGADTVDNMLPLDSSVNRSIGAQIQQQIKHLPVGTVIDKVTIK